MAYYFQNVNPLMSLATNLENDKSWNYIHENYFNYLCVNQISFAPYPISCATQSFIYLLTVYLVMLPAAQIMQHPIKGGLVNNEHRKMWREAVLA